MAASSLWHGDSSHVFQGEGTVSVEIIQANPVMVIERELDEEFADRALGSHDRKAC